MARPPTLRRRLFSLLVRAFLLFGIVTAVLVVYSSHLLRRDVVSQRRLLARTVAHHLDETISRAVQSLERIAEQLPALDETAVPAMRSFRFQSAFRDSIHLLDASGRPVISDPPESPPLPANFLGEHERVTPVYQSGPDKRPRLAVVQPFRREGRRYYMVAEMDPAQSVLRTFLEGLDTAPDLHLIVLDDSARVIASSRPEDPLGNRADAPAIRERIRATEVDVFRTRGGPATENGAHVNVLIPLQFAPWSVLVAQREDRAFAALHTWQSGILGAGILFAIGGVLLARALSRSLVEPIQSLSEQAEALRAGDLSHPIHLEGDHEVELLAGTLEGARRRLSESLNELQAVNEGLERQVTERTQTLREQNAQRRTLVRRLIRAGEEERKRIARELHDEISQLLTVIQLSLADTGLNTAETRRAHELLERTQKEIHDIIHDLRPSLLDDLGLAAAVRSHASGHLEAHDIRVHLEIEEELHLPPEVEITAFRIYQEIVTNVLRHAGAENVSIELYADAGELVLIVEDDGCGFEDGEQSEGAGITGMRERADLVSGSLSVSSEPEMGTQVTLRIPL